MQKYHILIYIIIALFLLAGCQSPGRGDLISHTFPPPDELLSAFGPVGVTFSEPMDQQSVEESFSFSQPVEGNFSWEGNTLWFRPVQAYAQDDSYRAHLSGTLETKAGQVFQVDESWQFSIRQAELIFLRDGEIWRSTQNGSAQRQLSSSDRQVVEFSADRSGEWVVYTLQNEMGGQNIWIMDRDGQNSRLLVDCERDQCSEPTFSVGQDWIAYVRSDFSKDTGGFNPTKLWKVAVETAETYPLGEGEGLFGHSPSFSPDGEKLAFYDTEQKGIQILDLASRDQIFIPSNLEDSGDWSQDGQRILFTDLVTSANQQSVLVKIYDLTTGETIPAFDEEVTDTDFSQPQWMPGDVWIAASIKPINDNGNKALWVIPLCWVFHSLFLMHLQQLFPPIPGIRGGESWSFSNYRSQVQIQMLQFGCGIGNLKTQARSLRMVSDPSGSLDLKITAIYPVFFLALRRATIRVDKAWSIFESSSRSK